MLEQSFRSLVLKYMDDTALPNLLWQKLAAHYSEPQRYYHNLQHLQNLLKELAPVKPQVADWDTIQFALYYHDIIYNPRAGDNEERSADEAVKDLQLLDYPEEQIALCKAHILATKGHTINNNNDTNLFTDADLSILGKDWDVYEEYSKAVRKEYQHVPDIMFSMGRKGVLQHLLAMPRIYKTEHFFGLYERQARENIEREMMTLGTL